MSDNGKEADYKKKYKYPKDVYKTKKEYNYPKKIIIK